MIFFKTFVQPPNKQIQDKGIQSPFFLVASAGGFRHENPPGCKWKSSWFLLQVMVHADPDDLGRATLTWIKKIGVVRTPLKLTAR